MDTLPFTQGRKKYSLAGMGGRSQEAPVVALTSKPLVSSQVESWATEFDQLLGDPAGLQTFAEFLKKEFSHENIYFWCACERFRRSGVPGAEEIIERHLGPGAWEPVNVDAAARSQAQDTQTGSGKKDMFLAPQKQIYNLMKFDSYGRFLKSELYNACLVAESKGRKLPYTGEDMEQELGIQERKRKTSETKCRRRSFLPWGQGKQKEKERIISRSSETLDTDKTRKTSALDGQLQARLTPSVSELNLRQRCAEEPVQASPSIAAFCRVIMPDGATSVVSLQAGQSVESCLGAMLARRGFPQAPFQVLEQESRLPLDLSRDCSKLAGREVRLLQGGQDEDRASLPLLGTLKHLSTSPAALRTEGKARPKSSPARGRGDNGGFVETDQGGCGEEGPCVAVGRSTEYLNPPSGGTR